ncbi:serine/threonine protein kinase [Phormidium tenue FACHB-886]|nr:serine/threonine protein kinase [Phormidium tenue FACHB-886]
MTYCLNPVCQKPRNLDDAKFCQNCGWKLWVGDRYQALELIGQGGFGRTFLAIDQEKAGSSEPAAAFCVIKQLLPREIESESAKAVDLFRREIELLLQLGQHQQIPGLLDHLESTESFYLIQEYIEGRNLEEILAQVGTFNEAQIWELLADILPVLSFVHDRQVIHRDIKPENIIRPGRSQANGKLVLVDFGASKYATETVLARTGTVIGSAGYVAPEQAMGKALFASDLYSLGVTCLHLLTGLHPFDLYSVSQDAWIWRQYLPQPVSSKLRQVLDKLVQRAVSQRYQTAAEVLRDLRPANGRSHQRLPSKPTHPSSWRCVQTLIGHTGEVTALSLSPNGQIVASGSSDRTIKLWRLETGELLHTFAGRSLWSTAGHRDWISALAFGFDGRVLISASNDGTVKLWNLSNRQLISTLPSNGWAVSAIAFDSDGALLVSGNSDGLIQLWDAETDEPLADLAQHQERVSALVIDQTGQYLVSGSYDRTICLWDLKQDRVIKTLRGHVDRVSALALTPDGTILISASWDKTLKIWDCKFGEQLKVISAHRDRINCLALHPSGKFFASGSEDSCIKLWDLQTGDRLSAFGHSWGVKALSFSTAGDRLVSGSADETIKIWQMF